MTDVNNFMVAILFSIIYLVTVPIFIKFWSTFIFGPKVSKRWQVSIILKLFWKN